MKDFILCSSVFLGLALMANQGHADEHFPYLAEVSKESVNVRSGPNTNFEKVDKLDKGVQVVVLGRSYEWLKVQPPVTTKLYIRSDYLSPKGEWAVVTGDNVNVRCEANADAASLGEVKKDTVVKTAGQTNGWTVLVAPVAGTSVWIHQDFLQETSPDVPPSMLAQTVTQLPAVAAGEPAPASSPVSPWVSIRGKIETLVTPPQADVHYEIVMGDKSVFYLQDIPHIDSFCNTVVDLQGAVVSGRPKKLMYPLLHINKIALVL